MESKVFNRSVATAVFHVWVFLESIIKEKTSFLSCHASFPSFYIGSFLHSMFFICNYEQVLRTELFLSVL